MSRNFCMQTDTSNRWTDGHSKGSDNRLKTSAKGGSPGGGSSTFPEKLLDYLPRPCPHSHPPQYSQANCFRLLLPSPSLPTTVLSFSSWSSGMLPASSPLTRPQHRCWCWRHWYQIDRSLNSSSTIFLLLNLGKFWFDWPLWVSFLNLNGNNNYLKDLLGWELIAIRDSQSVVPGWAASVSSGNLSEPPSSAVLL